MKTQIKEQKQTDRQVHSQNQPLNYGILKQEISQSNVPAMAELLALSETRFLVGYIGSRMQRMYADLYVDILNKNDLYHAFSDSYDLVQEGALFLCKYYGKQLNDVLWQDKNGKDITIKIMCMRAMSRLISRKARDFKRNVSLDALTPVTEPSCEIQEEITQDYTAYDSIVESLNLTENMRVALECRQNGLSYPEIAAILNRTQSTVFEYFIKMRQRYASLYNQI